MGNQTSIPLKVRLEENEKRLANMNRGKEVVEKSKNAQLIGTKLMHAYNMRDRKAIQNLLAPEGTFSFQGADACMALDVFTIQTEMLQDSFPDISVSYDAIKEVQPGVVKIINFRSRGTHTGAPFSFGPFPAIPTSGIVVEEDPSTFTIFLSNGKMTHVEIAMKEGDLIGPAGYYTKIGGKMDLVESP